MIEGQLIKANAPFERVNLYIKGPWNSVSSNRCLLILFLSFQDFPQQYHAWYLICYCHYTSKRYFLNFWNAYIRSHSLKKVLQPVLHAVRPLLLHSDRFYTSPSSTFLTYMVVITLVNVKEETCTCYQIRTDCARNRAY